MSFTRLAIATVVLSVAIPAAAHAESKWSFKKLIPSIGKKDDMPRGLFPASNEPSMWRKMNDGTKNLLAKSKKVVPSWLMPQTQDRVRKSAGSFKRSGAKIREELRTARRNILSPWSRPVDKTDQPKTVSDFIALPKPN